MLTPDFSIYDEWPLAIQIWNTYRARWCGALFVEWGLSVIPTAGWAGEESFDFCFDGLPRRSVVAVSAVGTRKKEGRQLELAVSTPERDAFVTGFYAMIDRLAPTTILCYGNIHPECSHDVPVVEYPTWFEGRRLI